MGNFLLLFITSIVCATFIVVYPMSKESRQVQRNFDGWTCWETKTPKAVTLEICQREVK